MNSFAERLSITRYTLESGCGTFSTESTTLTLHEQKVAPAIFLAVHVYRPESLRMDPLMLMVQVSGSVCLMRRRYDSAIWRQSL
ncbi:hypothetical protein BpHYR1_012125 [Brachionus plicatilis]|uniref:Uncharacterized protein n=1 Tax=Brachionus plicatilis TaxID=10195 RepID=A0A3M7SZX9_BRAPC|nr:hypothetical protein BpHYR1_012125 [Brachionus plicatilis]